MPRELRFESGADWASLTIPPYPAWIELGSTLLSMLSLSFGAVVLAKGLLLFIKRGVFPLLSTRAWVGIFIVPAAYVIMGGLIVLGLLINHHWYHHVPRRIEARAGTLRHTQRGLWGVRVREYGPDEIRDVVVEPLKDIFGRKSISMLRIRVGRWSVVQVRLKNPDPSFGRNVEVAFRTALFLHPSRK